MRQIGIGLIGGAGGMGRVHSAAHRAQREYFWPLRAEARLVAVADVDEAATRAVAERFGYERWTTDWREVVADPAVEAVHIVTPNHLHHQIALAAIATGKHVLCEKPLAMNAAEAREMVEAAERAGVVAMVAHNYRRQPAIQYARQLLAEGQLGAIYHFRGRYLQSWSVDPAEPLAWRFQKAAAGSGALGDIGSHLIDTARLLLGEIAEVSALADTFIKERPLRRDPAAPTGRVDVDDAVVFIARFASGALATFEASRMGTGHGDGLAFEISGSKGALAFDHERPNRLRLFLRDDPAANQGFRDVLISDAHPNALWRLPGGGVSYYETKILEARAFLEAIAAGGDRSPSFRDGARVVAVLDAVLRSAAERAWVAVPSD